MSKKTRSVIPTPQPPVFCAGSLFLCRWSDQKRVTRDKRGSEEEEEERLETIEGL